MIGFNHALVGALIGKFLPLPVAIPLAIISHFCLDALPHYGLPNHTRDASKFWKILFIADFFATAGLIIPAVVSHHYAVLTCGILAVIPDFVWVIRFLRTRSFNMNDNKSRYATWHAAIQHYERPWGIWIELPLAVVLLSVFYRAL
jgi:hypothetical protein